MKTPRPLRIPLFASLGEDVSTNPLSPQTELGYPLVRGRPARPPPVREEKEAA